MSARRYWEEMTSPELAAADLGACVAVLPLAAVEQHGPHLPLSVDACINEGIVARAVGLMPAALPALILPMVRIGQSDEHASFAGTLSLGSRTLEDAVIAVGEGVARAGVRRLVLLNSHGGQPHVLEIAALTLRRRQALRVALANTYELAARDDLFPRTRHPHDIHGGAVETSMMLHLRPDLVRTDRIRDFPSTLDAQTHGFTHLWPAGKVRQAWLSEDLNPAGAIGDASAASADAGRTLVERAATALVALIDELARLPAIDGPA